jgi:hypothetical protein
MDLGKINSSLYKFYELPVLAIREGIGELLDICR